MCILEIRLNQPFYMGFHHVIDRSNKTFDLKLNGTVSIDSIKPAYHLSDSLAPSQPQKQHESINAQTTPVD